MLRSWSVIFSILWPTCIHKWTSSSWNSGNICPTWWAVSDGQLLLRIINRIFPGILWHTYLYAWNMSDHHSFTHLFQEIRSNDALVKNDAKMVFFIFVWFVLLKLFQFYFVDAALLNLISTVLWITYLDIQNLQRRTFFRSRNFLNSLKVIMWS